MYFIGIDPGKKGALTVINENREYIHFFDYPEKGGPEVLRTMFRSMVKDFKMLKVRTFAAIERAQAMPNQGVVGVFTYGVHYGEWKMLLRCYRVPFEEVTPRTWQKGLGIAVPKDKKETKIRSCTKASQTFPAGEFFGVRGGPKDGRADSVWIADWCRRRIK